MIEIIIFFLLASLALYVIFAGADFGAGILEILCSKKDKEKFSNLVSHAIGPVWEANHIWIILVIVIVFSVFPEVYSTVSTIFHIPILIMLFGIVLRGCAFTFRHYDAKSGSSHHIYTAVFQAASLITPLAQGIIAGGLILADFQSQPESFAAAYINPWLNLFSFSVGLLLCMLCCLSASVFLYCEDRAEDFTGILKKRIRAFSILTFICGVFVFAAAEEAGLLLIKIFFNNQLSLISFILAICTLLFLNFSLLKNYNKNLLRALVSAISCFVLAGWWLLQFPYFSGIPGSGREAMHINNVTAPDAVLQQVVIALFAGSALIFPALFFLIRTFKYQKPGG